MTLTKGHGTNVGMVALDQRRQDAGRVVANSDGSPRVGVLGGHNPSIVATTAATAPMTVTVAAADFVCSKGTADGVTLPTNDGTVSVTINAAPGSNSRITVIWVKQQDNTTGDAASTPIFGTTDGTAAASPTKPSIPTGALELATLRVYAGTTASNGGTNLLTNTYQMTAMRGGRVDFRTTTERDAWSNPVEGQLAYCQDVDATFCYVTAAIGWVHSDGKPIVTALSFTGIYSAGSPTPRIVEQGGRVFIEGGVTSSSASFGAGATYTIGSIPSAKAPVATRVFPVVMQGSQLGALTIDSAGSISFTPSTAFGPASLSLYVAGSWSDKRLG